jgi:hypothetical protein
MSLTTYEFRFAFIQATKCLTEETQKIIWEMVKPDPVCPGAPKKKHPCIKYGRSDSD